VATAGSFPWNFEPYRFLLRPRKRYHNHEEPEEEWGGGGETLTLGARERKAWKEATREAANKPPVDRGRGEGRRWPPAPPQVPDPTLGGAGDGAGEPFGRRGIVARAEAWSLPRRSSAAATLLPIMAGGGAAAGRGRSGGRGSSTEILEVEKIVGFRRWSRHGLPLTHGICAKTIW
jgi:hypothetical protein